MHLKIFVFGIVILMVLTFPIASANDDNDDADVSENDSVTSCEDEDCDTDVADSTATSATEKVTDVEVTSEPVVTTKPHESSKSNKKQSKNRKRNGSSQGTSAKSFEILNVWVTGANSWPSYGAPIYLGRFRVVKRRKVKNNADVEEEDDTNEDNNGQKEKQTKKRKRFRIRFVARHYQDYRKFPLERFPTLVAISPWHPIFYDNETHQTIIFSRTGGVYMLPPLMNFYGQRFSVAQLLQWGYASFGSSGIPPSPNVDTSHLFQQIPAVNTNTKMGSNLLFDEKTARFNDPLKTNFLYVRPRYSDAVNGNPLS